MPFFAYEPKVGSDWQYEQVRSEINRLREVLRNPNLTAEERAIAQSQLDNYLTGPSEANVCAAKHTKTQYLFRHPRVDTPRSHLPGL